MTSREAFDLWWDVWGPVIDGLNDRELKEQCWRVWQASRLPEYKIETEGNVSSE